MFTEVSIQSGEVDRVFLFVLSICVIMFIFITFSMIYFVIRYNRKRHPKAVQIESNTTLEIIWTVIPTILVLAMFYYGWYGFDMLENAPKDAMVIKVRGRMWDWRFTYENGKKTGVLNVPVGKPVKLLMTSQDVVHSFYIPAFRIKKDLVPGMETSLWFQATKEGSYDVLCAEYCGTGHSAMITKVIIMPEQQFKDWYASPVIEEAADEPPGLKLLKEKGCMDCHTTDGNPLNGPSLKGLYGSRIKLIDNAKETEITADEEYLKRAIMEPEVEIVAGYENIEMPSPKNILNDKEVDDIIDYLKELK